MVFPKTKQVALGHFQRTHEVSLFLTLTHTRDSHVDANFLKAGIVHGGVDNHNWLELRSVASTWQTNVDKILHVCDIN